VKLIDETLQSVERILFINAAPPLLLLDRRIDVAELDRAIEKWPDLQEGKIVGIAAGYLNDAKIVHRGPSVKGSRVL
jgi:hypothetical protein